MFGKLEEFVAPQITPEELAFTAGYTAAQKMWHEMVEKGITPESANEFLSDVAYDHYITAMADYFAP
jgi:hypothetical protein